MTNKINGLIGKDFFEISQKEMIFMLKDDELKYVLFNKMPNKIDQLYNYESVLKQFLYVFRPFKVIQLLENSISQKNNPVIIQFIKDNYRLLDYDDHAQGDFMEIYAKILQSDPTLSKQIFENMKYLLADRNYTTYTLADKRKDEKEAVAKVLQQIGSIQGKYSEIWSYIQTKFDLVSDDGTYWHYSPKEIFQIVKEYIQQDVEKNFLEVTNVLINQYKEKKPDFKGTDIAFIGGVSSGDGPGTMMDTHFVQDVLSPVLEDYYNKIDKEKAWQFMQKHCITTDADKISAERPDFLNRACINVLVSVMTELHNKHHTEAKEILKAFTIQKIFSSKRVLIFQALHGLDDFELKWEFVKRQLDHVEKNYGKRVPDNEYLEAIIVHNLDKPDAFKEYKMLLQNEEYHKTESRALNEYFFSGLDKLLASSQQQEKGVELFETYIFSKILTNRKDEWHIWDMAKKMPMVLQIDKQKGFEILQKISDEYSNNKYMMEFLASSLQDIPSESRHLMKEAFDIVLKPLLQKLGNDTAKAFFVSGRVTLLHFAENLAKEGFMEEAWYLLDRFSKDPDPKKNSEEVKKLNDPDALISITTVRGWVAWALVQFGTLNGRNYIDKAIALTKKLAEDKNAYVRMQATYPLEQLAGVRHSTIESKERFMSVEDAEKIQDIAFHMLQAQENHQYPLLMKRLVHVFGKIRSIGTQDASKVLNTFRNIGDKVLIEALPLFIFFAVFREDAQKHQIVGYCMPEYDPTEAKKMLDELIYQDEEKIRDALLRNFKHLVEDDKDQYERFFQISYAYMQKIVENTADFLGLEDVYDFVRKNADKKYEECFELWKKTVQAEKRNFDAEVKKERYKNEMAGTISDHMKVRFLLFLFDRDKKEFLHWLDFILYEIPFTTNFDPLLEKLITLQSPQEEIEAIFDKIEKHGGTKYVEYRLKWEEKVGKRKEG